MESSKLYAGKFLEVYLDKIEKDNKTIFWERCSRKNKTNAVMIVARHISLNKYVMISEFRIPINDREIGFPAGLIDGNESAEETAKREIKEETGLDIVKITAVSPLVYNSSGMTDEGVYIVYADVDGQISQKFLEPTEDIIPMLVSKEEIKNLLANPTLKWGAKAWIICNNIATIN